MHAEDNFKCNVMKANELRIGNYIHVDVPISDESKLTRVGIITSKKVNGVKIEKYKPIPLTEDWLLKLGFVKTWHLNKNIYSLFIDDELLLETDIECFSIVFNEENFDLNVDIGKFTIYRRIDVRHVHQLQNLYSALTGEELTIK